MAPTIKFRAKNKGGNLVITVVSCTVGLPFSDLCNLVKKFPSVSSFVVTY